MGERGEKKKSELHPRTDSQKLIDWKIIPAPFLLGKLFHDAQGRAPVPGTEVIPVVQVVEQLVQLMSLVEPQSFGDLLVVGVVEVFPEAAEHPRDPQLELGMTVKRGRVEDHGAVGEFGDVAAPQVAVKQRRFHLHAREQLWDL